MKRKYQDEEIQPWIIFGEHVDGIHVDVADLDGDIPLCGIKREHAEFIIKQRDILLDLLYQSIWGFPEENTPDEELDESKAYDLHKRMVKLYKKLKDEAK